MRNVWLSLLLLGVCTGVVATQPVHTSTAHRVVRDGGGVQYVLIRNLGANPRNAISISLSALGRTRR